MAQEADEALSPGAIADALQTRWLGRSFQVYDAVDSTNSVLAEWAAQGAPAGAMILADFQSEGRGRRGRRWQAPPRSSLLVSLLFRPGWPAVQAHWLTMIVALATAAAVEAQAPLSVGLKWPNDVMLGDTGSGEPRWRKAGGVLLETSLIDSRIQQAIVGLGLNVNVDPASLPDADTPATSLLAATAQTVDRAVLLARILQRLEALYEQAAAGQSPQPAWDARLITHNRPVRVTTDEGVVQGMALGSDEWGRLLVRAEDGKLWRFAAGDVTLRSSGP